MKTLSLTALGATMALAALASGADAGSTSACATSGSCPVAGHNHSGARATSDCSASSCDYTVRRGDSLSRIAQQKLGATSKWRSIASLNNMRAPYLIRPGQVIKLPCAAGSGASCGTNQAATPARPNQAGYAAAATNGQAPTLRQLWERPVPSGLPQDNAPQGSELNREWNSRNNVLATGIADRIGPPPVTTVAPQPAAPLQAPFGQAAPTPIGSGAVPAVRPVTSGRPDLNRPAPPVVEFFETRK